MKLILLFLSVCCFAETYAQAGLLDSSFGGDGIVTTKVNSGPVARAVAVQPDGKIVVTGAFPEALNGFHVVRYLTNGKLDLRFGKAGKATVYIQHHFFATEVFAIALQKDGKILLGGYGEKATDDKDFAVARLNKDGSVDSTFGDDGSATFDRKEDYYEEVKSMAVQTDGKIVVAGWSLESGDFETVRFNVNGSIDSGFGNKGIVLTALKGGSFAQAVTLQQDGKIVVSGTTNVYDYGGFGIVRYMPDGRLDSSFGKDGIVATFIENDALYGYALAIQQDGKIVVGGNDFLKNDGIIIRYKKNGRLDSTFGVKGQVLLGTPFAIIYGLQIQQDNKIVAAGLAFLSVLTANDYGIWRVNTNGNIDSTFGSGGKTFIDYDNETDEAYGVAIAPDGKIVVTGGRSLNPGHSLFGTVRLTPDGQMIVDKVTTDEEDKMGAAYASARMKSKRYKP